MDLVKRIYVSDLNANTNANANANVNANLTSDTKRIIFTGTTTKYEMNKIDNNTKKKTRRRKLKLTHGV